MVFIEGLCASGLRAGVLYSQKEDIARTLRPLIWFRGLSSLTGWDLKDILSDTKWIDYFIAENRRRIAKSYHHVTSILKKYKTPFVRAEAGFFLVLDLRVFLEGTPSHEREMALF